MSDEKPKLGESAPKNKGNAGKGRPKGIPNKSTAAIKDMLLASLDAVGGQSYFMRQAEENPNAYMSLIGKIIPAEVKNQITGLDGGPVQHSVKVSFGDDSSLSS